jgi:hypothetical protein
MTKDEFKNVMRLANEHLEQLQRNGRNVEFFASLVRLLPDPNDPNAWTDPTLLETVRNHLCEQDKTVYHYAIVPLVAAGVAVLFSKTRKEFNAIAGLYNGAYRSKIRKDIFYWNHFNPSRQSLTENTRALRWAWHVLRGGGLGVESTLLTKHTTNTPKETSNTHSALPLR